MSLSDTQIVKDRSTGIGGTDSAAIISKNPWKTAVDIYLEKLLKLVVGNKLEHVVVQLFEARLPHLKVQTNVDLIRHPRFSFLLAHVDGLIGDNLVFEAKTCGMNAILSRTWGRERENFKAEIEDIPYQYYCQLQWYLMITNREAGYLACLMGGNEDFRIYYYPRNYELGIVLRKAAKNFWLNHVQKKS